VEKPDLNVYCLLASSQSIACELRLLTYMTVNDW